MYYYKYNIVYKNILQFLKSRVLIATEHYIAEKRFTTLPKIPE